MRRTRRNLLDLSVPGEPAAEAHAWLTRRLAWERRLERLERGPRREPTAAPRHAPARARLSRAS